MLHASVTAPAGGVGGDRRPDCAARRAAQGAGAAIAGVLAPDERAGGRPERGVGRHGGDRGYKSVPSDAQRRSLSGADDEALPSSETDVVLGISRQGDAMARHYHTRPRTCS
jgi:hypothetical protein